MDLKVLQSAVKGEVLTATSAGYDTVRTPWELTIDQRPRLIIMAKDREDIVSGVRFARDNRLKAAVTNTGHGIALPANDNMLIVVSDLNDVRIDPERRTARVEAGARWKDVLNKSHEAGLAPLLGSSSSVGAVGYTLGGGMGWLARKYGLAQDSVISYELVTAEGKLLTVRREVFRYGSRLLCREARIRRSGDPQLAGVERAADQSFRAFALWDVGQDQHGSRGSDAGQT